MLKSAIRSGNLQSPDFRNTDLLNCFSMSLKTGRDFPSKQIWQERKTAFIAEYGSGKPVIAFLGEFDALPGLSQKADAAERIPANPGSCGHGCGHQLIGTGTLASAIALKDFMKEHNLKGTIRYYGCPAEENAGGKAFLVRDGYFNDCDLALCWHPEQGRRACYGSTKANFRVFFTFHGTPAHASMCPELGRSALDAVELNGRRRKLHA